MTKTCLFLSLLTVFGLVGQAQTTVAARRYIRATGQATVSVRPDQATIQFTVVTQAATAQDAASRNADQVNAVLAALRTVIGTNGDLKTLSYSLTPNYNFPRDGGPATLIGYTASNTVEATLSDLSIIGRVIDTGVQAGANRVQGLRFGLKDDQRFRVEALRLATVQARAHVDAMAAGLGVRVGAPISIQEGSAVSVQPLDARGAATGTTTPIETGLVDVRATVTLEMEIA